MLKKKKQGSESKEKKSRAKYQCPKELADMIRLVNLVPPDCSLPSPERIFEKQIKEQQGLNTGILSFFGGSLPVLLKGALEEAFPETPAISILKVCIRNTPQEFQDYIENESESYFNGDVESDDDKFYRVAAKLIDFCDLRDSLQSLISRLEEDRKTGGLGLSIGWILFPLKLKTIVRRDYDGKLYLTGLAPLLGTFDESRLRRCTICTRIFWAKREESETCSAPCFGTLRTRRYRTLTAEEKAERKARREENRRQNKKLKEMRKNKNGTL